MFVRVKKRYQSLGPRRLVALDFVLVQSVRTDAGPRQRFVERVGCIHWLDLQDRDKVVAVYKSIVAALISHGQKVSSDTLASVKRHAPIPRRFELPAGLKAMEHLLLALPKSPQERAKLRYKWLRKRSGKAREVRQTGNPTAITLKRLIGAADEATKRRRLRHRSSNPGSEPG